MSDQLREEAPSGAVHAWDSARRLREPIAWILLALAAMGVVIGAWELFGLPGSPPIASPARIATSVGATATAATATGGHPAVPSTISFGLRASAVAPQFVADDIFALPIIAVVLVAFAGGLTHRARYVVETAMVIQIVTVGFGLLSWLGAFSGHVHADIWFIADARELAIIAAGLIFVVAVRRSSALRSPIPQFADSPEGEDSLEDADSAEDVEYFEVLGHDVTATATAFEDSGDGYQGIEEEAP
jgi:hypothetical protein